MMMLTVRWCLLHELSMYQVPSTPCVTASSKSSTQVCRPCFYFYYTVHTAVTSNFRVVLVLVTRLLYDDPYYISMIGAEPGVWAVWHDYCKSVPVPAPAPLYQ